MSWRVEFAPEVQQDVADAAEWYESRQPGLGEQFVEEVIGVWHALASDHYSIPDDIQQRTSAGATRTGSHTA